MVVVRGRFWWSFLVVLYKKTTILITNGLRKIVV